MNKLEELFKASSSASEYARMYVARLADVLSALDGAALSEGLAAIRRAANEQHTIYLMGNGGSGAVASHFVNDLGPNSLVPAVNCFRVISLVDNVESITAIANDSGYDQIFALQLESRIVEGDVVIGLSVSGQSENVVRAIRYAREQGAYTIGLVGFEGGRLSQSVDCCLHFPTTCDEYGIVEDVFAVLSHIISGYLTMQRGRFLAH